MRVTFVAALLALGFHCCPAAAHDRSEAKYLGNEGVLVTAKNSKILFDAFYAESFAGTYTLVPGALEQAMMQGKAPFDGVDAVFISHIHPDHFNSRKTIAYLRAHRDVRLYAPPDVIGAIRAADVSSTDPLMQRLTPIHLPPGGSPARFAIEGLAIEAYSIPHSGGGPVPHLAYRVTLGGTTTVMHLGDAGDDDRNYVPYQHDFDAKRTDVAFAPVWMLTSDSGMQILTQRIRSRKVIGIHAEDKARAAADRTRAEVSQDLFLEPGETRRIEQKR